MIQTSLKKWLNSGLGQAKYNMFLEHLVEHKNKEVLKNDDELLEKSQTAEFLLTKSGMI